MVTKLKQSDVIEQFSNTHRSKYDYSNVNYTGMLKPVHVVCHNHDEPFSFFPTPANHIRGSGCPKCSGNHKTTTEDFIKKAKEIHGDLYDYSQVSYTNAHKKVTIICPVHGDWEVKPNNHLNGRGCGRCANSVLKEQSQLLAEFVDIHGDKYDYSKVVYIGTEAPVDICCVAHNHWFEQSPKLHLRGHGCPICADEARSLKKRITLEEVIKRSKAVHGDTFDYSSVSITHNPLTVTLTCAKGHTASYSFHAHLNSGGCAVCSGYTKGSVDNLLEKFKNKHGDVYDYSLITEHAQTKDKVNIICKKHGVFEQEVSSHTTGCGCPSCSVRESKPEQDILDIFLPHFPDTQRRVKSAIYPKELDIFVPSKNFAIEYNGLVFHSTHPTFAENPIRRHKDKTDACKAKGIHLFHLYEDDWLMRPDVVKHTLKHLLGISENTVYARKTTIKQHKLSEVKDFYNKYHMQGAPYQGSLIYALYDQDEMVACMTFSKPSSERGNTESGRYELLRYACKYSVVGGASKLFKHFVKEHEPTSVVSYSDDSMFSGKMYEVLGFKEVGKVEPDYKVIDGKVRKHKSAFRRSELIKRLGDKFDPELSERENCHNNGLYRIYNSGLTKWEWKQNT